MPIQNKAVSKTLEAAQKRVEGYNFDTRKNVVQYDNVINRHRRVVYVIRRKILDGENIRDEIERLISTRLRELTVLPSKNNPKFAKELQALFPLSDEVVTKIGTEKRDKARYELAKKEVMKLYRSKEKELETENMRRVEREVYMVVLDNLWMQHLEDMQHLREGIHWRSVGQRDPLVEYRSESQKLFEGLQRTLEEEVLRVVFNVHRHDAVVQQAQDDEYETELTRLSENAVEKGVNQITGGEKNRDDDFTVKKAKTASDASHTKNVAKKKKKAQRQNRKKGRK